MFKEHVRQSIIIKRPTKKTFFWWSFNFQILTSSELFPSLMKRYQLSSSSSYSREISLLVLLSQFRVSGFLLEEVSRQFHLIKQLLANKTSNSNNKTFKFISSCCTFFFVVAAKHFSPPHKTPKTLFPFLKNM